MTLENCRVLLKHFESIVNGSYPRNPGHKDWKLVVDNAKISIESLKKRIEHKLTLPQYAVKKKEKPKEEEKVKEKPMEEKDDGKKSKGSGTE